MWQVNKQGARSIMPCCSSEAQSATGASKTISANNRSGIRRRRGCMGQYVSTTLPRTE